MFVVFHYQLFGRPGIKMLNFLEVSFSSSDSPETIKANSFSWPGANSLRYDCLQFSLNDLYLRFCYHIVEDDSTWIDLLRPLLVESLVIVQREHL